MARTFLVLGAVLAGLAVALGAFAAHGLAPRVTPERLQTFETAVRYQMYHALALLLTGWLLHQLDAATLTVAGWCFLAGIVLFSGSLYVLVLADVAWLGALAPLGGAAFMLGWGVLAWGLWQALRA